MLTPNKHDNLRKLLLDGFFVACHSQALYNGWGFFYDEEIETYLQVKGGEICGGFCEVPAYYYVDCDILYYV